MDDVMSFLDGAPFLLDLEPYVPGLTAWFNRVIFVGQAPYVLVMVIFSIVTVIDLVKLALEKTQCWPKSLAEFRDRLLVPTNQTTEASGKLEGAAFGASKESGGRDDATDASTTVDGLTEPPSEPPTPPQEYAVAAVNVDLPVDLPCENSTAEGAAGADTVCSWPEKLKAPLADRTAGTWQIYDWEYDLTDFMAKHPGGGRILEMTRGTDATLLFESYHVMITRDRLETMMKPYLVKDSTINRRAAASSLPILPPEDEMHGEIKAMVRRRLQKKPNTIFGKSHKMNYEAAAIRFSVLALGWYMNCRLVFYGDVTGLVITPVAHWFAGAVCAHEGSHFSAWSYEWANALTSFFGGWPWQFNSSAWLVQHTIQHHQYTDSYADVDLFQYLPAVRMSRHHTKWNFMFKSQWWLIFFLIPTVSAHLNFAVPIDLLLGRPVYVGPISDPDVSEAEKNVLRYHQCVHLRQLMKVLKGPMLLELLGVVAYLVVLVLNHGMYKGLLYYTFMMIISSWFFIIFTQGAHLREDVMDNVSTNAQFDEEGKNSNITSAASSNAKKAENTNNTMTLQGFDDKSGFKVSKFQSKNPIMGRWVREQIHYTVDFCTDSTFWMHWSGGLNMQALHHVLPGVSHCHLSAMYPEFVEICRKHDVEVRACKDFNEFVMGFVNWVKCLSIEDELWNREHLEWKESKKTN